MLLHYSKYVYLITEFTETVYCLCYPLLFWLVPYSIQAVLTASFAVKCLCQQLGSALELSWNSPSFVQTSMFLFVMLFNEIYVKKFIYCFCYFGKCRLICNIWLGLLNAHSTIYLCQSPIYLSFANLVSLFYLIVYTN